MIHPGRRLENLKKIEEMDKRDAEPDWKTWCMNSKVDMVEVVRCKDCKWYDEKMSFCDNCYLPREQKFFCADGERRTE